MSNFINNRYIRLLAVWVIAVVAVILLTTETSIAATSDALKITVYRDPACGCCGNWMNHLTTQGFEPKNVVTADMDALKQQYGVPNDLASCHTAIINGYVIEGHVPAADIKRLIAQKLDVTGIAVPGMPNGSPGMESEDAPEPFTVFSFDQQKAEAFNHYSL